MRSEVTRRWIDAGKIIAESAKAEVICPVCQSAVLKIWDVSSDCNEALFERHMFCENCGAYNILRLKREISIPRAGG